MVRVTESALALLRELKAKHQAPEQVLRIVREDGGRGYKLVLGHPQADDEVVQDQGVTLAYIAKDAAAAWENSTMVSQSTPEGLQLAVNTPQPYPFGPLSELIKLSTPS